MSVLSPGWYFSGQANYFVEDLLSCKRDFWEACRSFSFGQITCISWLHPSCNLLLIGISLSEFTFLAPDLDRRSFVRHDITLVLGDVACKSWLLDVFHSHVAASGH